MSRIRRFINAMVFSFFAPLMAYAEPYFNYLAPPSLADLLHLSRSKYPGDHGWLPDITGLPDMSQVLRTQQVVDAMLADNDLNCISIDWNLRQLIFDHFLVYQQMINAQQIYLDSDIAQRWALVLAMIIKESSGDSASVTDMHGHTISTYEPETNLQQWNRISSRLPQTSNIKLDYQTNFGLTQTSADRLVDAFKLAKDLRYDTSYLEGKEGAETPGKIRLNTAIAIRRLIWLYQDFAQGRTVQSEGRISQQDINKPEFAARYQKGLNMSLLYCGTRLVFREGESRDEEPSKLQKAMASISYCELGNPQTGYGVNKIDILCFAKWVTLCPALNIDIATLTPLSYFATRKTPPVCFSTFNRLINKKPDGK